LELFPFRPIMLGHLTSRHNSQDKANCLGTFLAKRSRQSFGQLPGTAYNALSSEGLAQHVQNLFFRQRPLGHLSPGEIHVATASVSYEAERVRTEIKRVAVWDLGVCPAI